MKKRIVSFTVVVALVITGIAGRLGYIMFSGSYTVSDSYNSYTLVLARKNPTLYYSNGERMTYNEYKYIAVFRPNSQTLYEIDRVYSYNEAKEITNELAKGYPVTREIDKNLKNKFSYVKTYKVYATENTCHQLVNKASSGLYKYLDSEDKLKINFTVDAKGRLLAGDEGTLIDDGYSSHKGLRLTIDEKIQQITYDACNNLESGCAIVMNVADGSILACVNKPDDTYINKCFSQYSAGSVFKIVVAACALEGSLNPEYTCTGSVTVGDTVFSCQNDKKHGTQTLKQALANSCNCYFVNLALALGEDKILKLSKELGYSSKTYIYGSWSVDNAMLPDAKELSSPGQLALFGFGQGSLTVTPLQICSTLCTVANDGAMPTPHLIKNTVSENGTAQQVDYAIPNPVLAKSNSDKLITYLRYVVTNGTAANAEDEAKKSAGKTATAQTGQYSDGKELLNTWFAGVYPYDNPQYAIVIMKENGSSGAGDCCPIFRSIVENLDN